MNETFTPKQRMAGYLTSTPELRGEDQKDERNITFADAIVEAMRLEMARDETVFFIGHDSHWGVALDTRPLLEEFGPERVLPAPIDENGIVSAAVGAALTGMRPVCEIGCSDFMLLAADALFNQAAKFRYLSGGVLKVPAVFRVAATGPGYGIGLHHSQSLECIAMHFPGLKVVFPSSAAEAKGLFQASVRDDNPVLFLEHKMLNATRSVVPAGDYIIPLGKANVVKQGADVTLVSYGYACVRAQRATKLLSEKGIDVELIDLRTLLPLDKETMLASVRKTGRLVAIAEDTKTMGAGAEFAAIVAEEAFHHLKAPVRRVAGPDTCVPGCRESEKLVGTSPSVEDIVDAVESLFDRRSGNGIHSR